MPILHIFCAITVAVIWGLNFLVVKIGLEEVSPLLLCSFRFILASVPAIFFIKPPKAPAPIIITYGLVMFALQFSFFFVGMSVGMTPGMASLIIQVQVFFSIIFAAFILHERPSLGALLGALVSFMGIVVVGFHCDQEVTLLGVSCILASAATWGIGNLITKKIHQISMLGLVVWGSFVASFPLLFCSLALEGFANLEHSLHQMTWRSISALIYIVYCSTWIGYGLWNWLLSRYPVSRIVPFTLLVPVAGMLASVLFLHETLSAWKMLASILVVTGLMINIVSSKIKDRVSSRLEERMTN